MAWLVGLGGLAGVGAGLAGGLADWLAGWLAGVVDWAASSARQQSGKELSFPQIKEVEGSIPYFRFGWRN